MSAFMVSKAHIDALVHVALYGPALTPASNFRWNGVYFGETVRTGQRVAINNVNELGAMLTRANLHSIHARYPSSITEPEHTPGPGDRFWERPYQFNQFLGARIPAVTAFKLIGCYEYQSCEFAEWPESGAYRFCQSLTASLVATLPGYDAAPWGIHDWSDIKPVKPELADAPVREAARFIAEKVLEAKRKEQDAVLLQMPTSQRKLF